MMTKQLIRWSTSAVLVGAMVNCKKDNNSESNPAPNAAKTTADEAPEKDNAQIQTPRDTKAAFNSYMEAFNSQNADALAAHYAETVSWEQLDSAHSMRGSDASNLISSVKQVWSAFPDMKTEPQLVLQNGNSIAAISLTTGTNTGALMGMPATNKKLSMFEAQILRFDDSGKIVDAKYMSDHGTMAHQMGMAQNPMAPESETAWPSSEWIVASDSDTEKSNLEFFASLTPLVTKGDLAGFMKNVSDDISFRYIGDKKVLSGKKDYEKGFSEWLDMATHNPSDEHSWAAGDWVVSTNHMTHTLKMDLPGTKGTKGKDVSLHVVEFARIKDGKLATHWVFENTMAYPMQLGLMEPGPGKHGGPQQGKEASPH